MARPTEAQQIRARSRIRAIVEMRPEGATAGSTLPRAIFSHKRGLIAGDVVTESRPGVFSPRYVVSEVPRYGLGFANTFGFTKSTGGKGRQAQKMQVARLLGYKGGRKNMIRSVDRVIMRDRKSNQARRLRSTKQIEAVDRSFNYYVQKTGVIVIDKNKRLDIKGAVLARANLAGFRANEDSVFRARGDFLPTDVITIFNKRIEILLEQEDTESLALTIIFREEGIPPDVWADMTIEQRRDLRLNLFARDAFPDNTNMTTVVVG